MKTNILLAALVCLVLTGCKNPADDDTGGKKGKTDAELRAERNKPIYAQFIGEWDEYFDEEYLEPLGSDLNKYGIIADDNKFVNISSSTREETAVDYADIIYTLEEFKAVSTYPGNVQSNDLTKDGFIRFKRNSYDLRFWEYHFYDADKFKLKIVSDDGSGGIGYYKRVQSGGDSGETVNLPGSYELTAGTYTCTLTFNSNGTYVFDHPVGTNDRNGEWTQNGGELTMSCTVAEAETTISEVFITTEEGSVVTLTLKDTSADISQILVNFNIMATSVALTKK
jgi:hypothetical protein